jgi:hypothetical protein
VGLKAELTEQIQTVERKLLSLGNNKTMLCFKGQAQQTNGLMYGSFLGLTFSFAA